MKKTLTISILFLFIGIGIGISIVNWTNAEDNVNSTAEYITVEELSEYTGIFGDTATVINYLKNGNFYSEGKPNKLTIDTSLMSRFDSAFYWYDKTISEYPNTPAANRALKDKMLTILGWTEGYGDDKISYGLKDPRNAATYFPMLEETYTKLETNFPNDPHLQAFAYQIGQEYFFYLFVNLNKKYAAPSRKWMNKTIEYANGKDTFYSHLTKHYLEQIAMHE